MQRGHFNFVEVKTPLILNIFWSQRETVATSGNCINLSNLLFARSLLSEGASIDDAARDGPCAHGNVLMGDARFEFLRDVLKVEN